MKITYHIVDENEFDGYHRETLASMLEQQGKVNGPFDNKIDNCKFICIVNVEGGVAGAGKDVAAIGAIKQKTQIDFSPDKANLPELAGDFEWELGYIYTKPEYKGQGMASSITRMLLSRCGDLNLMASTEVTANRVMVSILEKNGFRLFGKPWKSSRHDNFLGLFLRYR